MPVTSPLDPPHALILTLACAAASPQERVWYPADRPPSRADAAPDADGGEAGESVRRRGVRGVCACEASRSVRAPAVDMRTREAVEDKL